MLPVRTRAHLYCMLCVLATLQASISVLLIIMFYMMGPWQPHAPFARPRDGMEEGCNRMERWLAPCLWDGTERWFAPALVISLRHT